MPTPSTSQAHHWKFIRAGGVDQVLIRSGADIAHLHQLDQKLWVALACPTRGVAFDHTSLDLIDSNGDGRIRAPELLQACQWALERLNNPDALASGQELLQLHHINTEHPDGPALLAQAQRILQACGQADASALSLAQVQHYQAQYANQPFNGDGILPPQALAHQPPLQALAQDIMQAYGTSLGHDGEPGLGQEQLQQYQQDLQAWEQWLLQGAQHTADLADAQQAQAAAQALQQVQAKVDDFFARCRLARFDAQATDALNPSSEGYNALAAHLLHEADEDIAALPLATISAQGQLPLETDFAGINPAWAGALAALQQHTITALLGQPLPSLDAAQWQQLKQRLAPCQQWLAARPSTPIATQNLDLTQAQTLLASGQLAELQALIEQDRAEQAHQAPLQSLHKLILLQRDLLRLLNNFVSFSGFYSHQGAIFQAGRLYLDGRSCDLTIDVQDPGAHAALAGLSKVYLAYCECRRGEQVRHIVAAFTAGDVDFLLVGRKGLFYDREGQDWDATITALIEQPTSVAQAFFAPYKKLLRLVEEQVAKYAAAKDAAVTEKMQDKTTHIGQGSASTVQALTPKKVDVGTVAALGVALGSISTVLVAVLGKFIALGVWIPVALLAALLAISGPSMLIAWLKLRQRSLGPILDASGWAINGRMKINLSLGRSLSQLAQLPPGAEHSLHDPYADRRLWPWLLGAVLAVLLAVLAWSQSWLDTLLPPAMQYQAVVQATTASTDTDTAAEALEAVEGGEAVEADGDAPAQE